MIEKQNAFIEPTVFSWSTGNKKISQVWSNDRYESVEHRVVASSKKERFSIPFFFSPSHYVMVEPLEELTNEESPAKYKAYNWGKFKTTRNLSNFKKLNVENIQIYHFRIGDL